MTTLGDDLKTRIDTDWSLAASINGTIASQTFVYHTNVAGTDELKMPHTYHAKIATGTPAKVLIIIHSYTETFQATYKGADMSLGLAKVSLYGPTEALVDSVQDELIRIGRDYAGSKLRFSKNEILFTGEIYMSIENVIWERLDAHA